MSEESSPLQNDSKRAIYMLKFIKQCKRLLKNSKHTNFTIPSSMVVPLPDWRTNGPEFGVDADLYVSKGSIQSPQGHDSFFFARDIEWPSYVDASRDHKSSYQGAEGLMYKYGPNIIEKAYRLFLDGISVVPCALRPQEVMVESVYDKLAAKTATISLSGFGGSNFGFNAFNGTVKNPYKTDSFQIRKVQQFNCLAKLATISSLSSFGGSNFGFDALYGMFNKLHKQDSSQSGEYGKHGRNLRMATSYNNIRPIVATASNNKYKWVQALMTAVAATAIATNPASQSKLQEILIMGAMTMATNFPLGMWREHDAHHSSPPWFTAVLATISLMPMLGSLVLMSKSTMVYTLGATILGHALGSMAEQSRLTAIAAKHPPPPPPETRAFVGVGGSGPTGVAPDRIDTVNLSTRFISLYVSLFVFEPSSRRGR